MKLLFPAMLAVLLGVTATATAIDEIKLVGGDTLLAEVLEATDEAIVIQHPVLGEVRIPRDQVLSIRSDVDLEAEAAAAEAAAAGAGAAAATTEMGADIAPTPAADVAEAQPEPAPEEELAAPKPWSWNADVSFVNVTGNTDETALRLNFQAMRRINDTRWSHDATYYWKQTDGITTDNKFTYLTRHDWLKSGEKTFWFVDGSFDYDEFESWTTRITSHGGLGYHFIEQEEYMELDGLLGIGVRKEFQSQNDEWLPEGMAGIDFMWQITERQRLVAFGNFFPVVTDIDSFRTLSGVEWRYVMEGDLPLTVSAGLRHEYQNQVDPGKDRNDLRVWVGLGVTY